MLNQPHKIQTYILAQVARHPSNIAAKVCKKFKVSRMTATRHLNALVSQKKLIKTGVTSNVVYHLFDARSKTLTIPIAQTLDEFKVCAEYLEPSLRDLPVNQIRILEYCSTELINNAKDHSLGKNLTLQLSFEKNSTHIQIIDDGIGVFKKLQRFFHLSDVQEGLLMVTKGRVTTNRLDHTGEGVFFSSRAVDRFILEANEICYIKDNVLDEWFYQKSSVKKGSAITLIVHFDCTRQLPEVFKAYTELEDYQFDKTEILVELAKLGDERYISRSQAKRILADLERFNEITLDFRHIESVGQGFVDEVFRVFQHKHPHIKIHYRHANDEVVFMIKRGR